MEKRNMNSVSVLKRQCAAIRKQIQKQERIRKFQLKKKDLNKTLDLVLERVRLDLPLT